MNIYRRIINELGLCRDHQNYHGQLYLMLALLGDLEAANPTVDTYSNPWREVLHRMRNYRATPAYQQLETLIGTRAY